MPSTMKIGILGTGEVGQALGRGFISRGHDVKMGSRDANNEKAKVWANKAGAKASVGTFTDAAKFGDVLAICTAWSGTKQALELAGPKNFEGKVVLDVTNPLTLASGKPELAVGHTNSGGEEIQRWLPGAKVVKVFNIVGNAHMCDPEFPGGPPDMFIAGNDADAKKIVSDICKSFGWPTIDIGGIEGARLLEPMCILWVRYAVANKSSNHAFKLLRK
jgi:8-hydroxy-5-deazaflavin:NADPH oxidoreductase